jgi:hypothetical protein
LLLLECLLETTTGKFDPWNGWLGDLRLEQ